MSDTYKSIVEDIIYHPPYFLMYGSSFCYYCRIEIHNRNGFTDNDHKESCPIGRAIKLFEQDKDSKVIDK